MAELEVGEALTRQAIKAHPQVAVGAAPAEVVFQDSAEHVALGLERDAVGDHPVQGEVVAVALERGRDGAVQHLFLLLVSANVGLGLEARQRVVSLVGEAVEGEVQRHRPHKGRAGVGNRRKVGGHSERSGHGGVGYPARRALFS